MIQKDIQKNIFLEQKVLEFNFDGNKNKTQLVYDIISNLTPYGFEIYIINYLKRFGIKMKHTGGHNKKDNGLDAIGQGLYLQCKKFHRSKDFNASIGCSMLRDFFGGMIDYHIHKNNVILENNMPIGLFATTVNFTEEAKKFAQKNNIYLLNYHDISNIAEEYTLEDFKKEIINKLELKKIFKDFQLNLCKIKKEDLVEEDFLFYYKEIRKKISFNRFKTDSKVGYIFNNKTLEEFSRYRIKDIESFYKMKQQIKDVKEKEKLGKFEDDIIKAIQIFRS